MKQVMTTSNYSPFKIGDTLEVVDSSDAPFVRTQRVIVTGVPSASRVMVDGRNHAYRADRFRRTADAPPVASTPAAAPVGQLEAPDTNPKTRFGMLKVPLGLIPATAKAHVASAFRDGAIKYGPANWRTSKVSASVYLNAAHRHIDLWQDGEEIAEDSGVHHLAHAAACLMIILDAQANGALNDDRPPAAVTGEVLKALTLKEPS